MSRRGRVRGPDRSRTLHRREGDRQRAKPAGLRPHPARSLPPPHPRLARGWPGPRRQVRHTSRQGQRVSPPRLARSRESARGWHPRVPVTRRWPGRTASAPHYSVVLFSPGERYSRRDYRPGRGTAVDKGTSPDVLLDKWLTPFRAPAPRGWPSAGRRSAVWSGGQEGVQASGRGQGVVTDRLDERGGDGVGPDPGVGRQGALDWGIGAAQRAVKGRRDDVAGDQGDAEAGVRQVQGGRGLLGADRGARREARARRTRRRGRRPGRSGV